MVGAEIKKYLNQNGIKQRFMAEKLGISVQTFNGICNEKVKIDVERYFILCEMLGVSPSAFKPSDAAEQTGKVG